MSSREEIPKTMRENERQRLVAIVAGVLSGVYAAGLLDGLFAVWEAQRAEPWIDVVASLVLHMGAGVLVMPLAAVVAYGWMPLRWWIREDWRPSPKRLLATALGVGVVLAAAASVYVWKRGIVLSAIDYRPLGLLALGLVVGVALYRAALRIGPWMLLVPLLASAIGTLVWHGTDLERTGEVFERLSFNGLTSRVGARVLQKWSDGDGDGFPRLFCHEACDCDDTNPEVSPVAVEIPDNGIDDDCVDGDLDLPDAPAVVERPTPPRPAPTTEQEEERLKRPNILLITIDTLRADHLGMYGYHRPTSPRMDALAAEGVVFKQARSQGPMTCFSVPVLMSGRYYSELKRTSSKWPQMHADNLMMPEILLEAGYHTASVHSIGYFVPLFQFDQGFLYYDASIVHERSPTHFNPTSDLVTDKVLAYFDRVISKLPANQPWFFWAYYGDPHSGYIRHKGLPEFGPTFKDIYDQEILYTDLHIGRLLDGLRERNELDTAVVVITADHGEGLDKDEDHGMLYHGQHVFDNLLRVPLVFWGQGIEAGQVQRPVGNIDVLPTLLELADVPQDEGWKLRGNSLVPFLEGQDVAWPPVFVEKTPEQATPEKAMIKWPWKIIWKLGINRFTLYNLEEDPNELREVSGQHPQVFEEMKRDIQIWRATVLDEIPPIK